MGVRFSQWYLGHIAIHQELRARLKREKDLRMKKLIFALIAGTAAMTAAQAQTTITPRPYIGIGASGVDREYNVQGATMRDNDGYRFGGKVFGGAELTENLGVEAGYTARPMPAMSAMASPSTPRTKATAPTLPARQPSISTTRPRSTPSWVWPIPAMN
jgi:hypothetical protein